MKYVNPPLFEAAKRLLAAMEREEALELDCAHAREERAKAAEEVRKLAPGGEYVARIGDRIMVVNAGMYGSRVEIKAIQHDLTGVDDEIRPEQPDHAEGSRAGGGEEGAVGPGGDGEGIEDEALPEWLVNPPKPYPVPDL